MGGLILLGLAALGIYILTAGVIPLGWIFGGFAVIVVIMLVMHFAHEKSRGVELLEWQLKLNIDKKAFGTKKSATLWNHKKDGRFEVRIGKKNSMSYDDTKLVFFSYNEEEARDFYDRFLLSPAAMLASPQEPKHDKPLENK